MIKSIRHLRGSSADWISNDIIVPDGELAIERQPHGLLKIKVGDGITRYSMLSSITGDTEKCENGIIRLKPSRRYRFGTASNITVSLPSAPDDDFYCEISFDSPSDQTEFTVEGGKIRMTGDGVADYEFIPDPMTHYTVFIWYDGEYQGVVRGVSNAP